jgi:DNA polymerase elongation subunit (family B)
MKKWKPENTTLDLLTTTSLITRGIDTRRHDSPAFITEFQTILLSKLFDCHSSNEVLTVGYQNALSYITQSIDKLMNGEVKVTDLVISKLLRRNIEKYRSLFPHVAAAIRLNVSGVIANRGDFQRSRPVTAALLVYA